MKKIFALTLAAVISAAVLTGCGCSKESENKDQIDIGKVDGVTLKSETDAESAHVVIGDTEVTIGDAKVIEYNGEDVAIVEFEFKNNGSKEVPFTGVARADAYQDERTLTPTVIDNTEGVDMLSLSENVAKGHQISVQKAYRLRDTENVLEVQVTEITSGAEIPETAIKYFAFE